MYIFDEEQESWEVLEAQFLQHTAAAECSQTADVRNK